MNTGGYQINVIGDWLEAHNGAIVALATIFLAIFTWGLWISTNRLWKHSKESLESVERAFVHLDGFNVELTVATDGTSPLELLPERYRDCPEIYVTRFAFQPRWKNAGNTPTKNLRVNVNWRGTEGPIPPEYAYKNRSKSLFVAPQAIETGEFIEIPSGFAHEHIDYAMNPIGEHPMLMVWGRADYEDIFGHSHFVEWCYSVRFEDHRRQGLRAGFIQWGEYNNSD